MSRISPRRRKSWGRPRDATDTQYLAKIEEIVDAALSPKLKQPDWQTNLSLCDLVNTHPERLSELTIKALDRRLKKEPPLHRQRLHGLTLLDMLVKNCGPLLHQSVAHPDFVATLLSLAGKKVKKRYLKKGSLATKTLNYEKELVQEKVLSLFQAWGPLHKDTLPIFNKTYTHLRAKGVEFPEILPEDETPWLNDGPGGRARHESFQYRREEAQEAVIPDALKERLESYKQASILLEQVIKEMDEGEDASKNEICTACFDTLKTSTPKIKKWIEENVEKEKLLAVLFLVLDRVNNSLELYERHSGEQRVGAGDDNEDDNEDQDEANNEHQEEEEEHDDHDEWRKSLQDMPKSSMRYSTSDTLQIPSASDYDTNDSIAIGLDFLASLSAKSEVREEKKDDPFLDWLLGPPQK